LGSVSLNPKLTKLEKLRKQRVSSWEGGESSAGGQIEVGRLRRAGRRRPTSELWRKRAPVLEEAVPRGQTRTPSIIREALIGSRISHYIREASDVNRNG
jgi:hypothetical protein